MKAKRIKRCRVCKEPLHEMTMNNLGTFKQGLLVEPNPGMPLNLGDTIKDFNKARCRCDMVGAIIRALDK